MTGASYRMMYGQGDYTRESVFMRELDPSVLDPAGDAVYRPNRRTNNGLGIDTGSLDGFASTPGNPYGSPARRPYDMLERARRSLEQKAAGASAEFEAGDRVSHGKFGEGLVIEADDKTVTVMFDGAGRKKLAKGIAPLQKL